MNMPGLGEQKVRELGLHGNPFTARNFVVNITRFDLIAL